MYARRCFHVSVETSLSILATLCLFSIYRKRHMAMKRKTYNFSCSVLDCVKTFATPLGLRNHMIRIHRNLMPHQCEPCHVGFENEQKLHDHLKHHDSMMPQCDKKECGGRRFPNENLLAKHVAQQHSQKRILFKCHLCEKKIHQEGLA